MSQHPSSQQPAPGWYPGSAGTAGHGGGVPEDCGGVGGGCEGGPAHARAPRVAERRGGSGGGDGAGFYGHNNRGAAAPPPLGDMDANPTWPSGAPSSHGGGGGRRIPVLGGINSAAGGQRFGAGGAPEDALSFSLNAATSTATASSSSSSTPSRDYSTPYQHHAAGAQVPPHTFHSPTTAAAAPSPHALPPPSDLRSDLYNGQPTLPRQSHNIQHHQRVEYPSGTPDRASPSVPRSAPASPYHRSPYSANTAPQDQLERLAAEAQSVLSGTPFTPERLDSTTHQSNSYPPTPSRSSSTSTTTSSYAVQSPPSRERSGLDRERTQASPLTVVPESPSPAPLRSAPAPFMSSTNANPGKAIPRSSSIDSAISSASAQSGIGHSHSQSNPSNNLLPNVTGTSPADVQSLIQAAGSAEELVRYMLKDKQSLTAQNAQLWRLVDKQRGMILGLNKDLERALREKDRYRTKFKERMAMAPPNLGGIKVSATSARSTSESPAPSLDDRTDRGPGSPDAAARSGIEIPRAAVQTTPSLSDAPIAEEHDAARHSETVSPVEQGGNAVYTDHEADRTMSPVEYSGDIETPRQQSKSTPEGPSEITPKTAPQTSDSLKPQSDVNSATPISASTQSASTESNSVGQVGMVPISPPQKPVNRKLGISTNVPPAMGLGKSPIRKAPPAPLALAGFQTMEVASKLRQDAIPSDDGEDLAKTNLTVDGYNSWENTPEDKLAFTPAPTPANVSDSPPTRAAPVPEIAQAVPPTPSYDETVSPRIRPQFVKAPLPSPGLPSSPRPSDRPMNSPKPRNSRILDGVVGLPGSPKPGFMSPRMSMPAQASYGALPSPRPPFAQGIHERSGSAGSMSSLTNFVSSSSFVPDSPMMKPFALSSSAIPSIDARVVSSRMRPSRSGLTGKSKGADDACFTLGVFSRADGKELVRVEKDANSLFSLDSKLRKAITFSVKLPDKGIFSGHAPARVDARRTAIDTYFSGVLGATMDERATQILCDFLSSDVVETSPGLEDENSPKSTEKAGGAPRKEGFLTKKGKNFGGWKERYFVLDGPVLKYFDRPDGAHLGQIKLQSAQIGRQSAHKSSKDDSSTDEDQYRHAFLVLEPKRKDTSTLVRHVLCAESDAERDEWVQALLEYVKAEEEAAPTAPSKPQQLKKRNGSKKDAPKEQSAEDKAADEALRALSYEETNAGPAPARGPTPEELNRQRITPSPSSMLSQPGSQPYAANSPIPDRSHPAKQISGPSGGSVISDLAAWGQSKGQSKLTDKQEKALKKRSIWGFRQRSSSDLSSQAQNVTGQQAAAERFPLPRHVFGATLEEAVYLTRPPGMEIALPAVVYRCLEYLDAKSAIEEEGIFRLSGSNVVIKGLKDRFNSESDLNLVASDEYYDVHAIASLLKLYLRELPNNILTSERRDDFVQVTEMSTVAQKVKALNYLVHALPIENFSLLKALSGHLLRIVDNADINKMTIRNIGIVFSPTLNIPAQVFSMFLTEYKDVFFADGEVPQSPQPLHHPLAPPPKRQPEITQPGTPTYNPLQRIPLPPQPGTPRIEPPFESYEPAYERREPSSPTSSIGTTLSNGNGGIPPGMNLSNATNTIPSPTTLGVPVEKTGKSKRRESSMMFMMGGMKKGMFDKSPSKSAMVVEDNLYE